jgi:hypothetical protein
MEIQEHLLEITSTLLMIALVALLLWNHKEGGASFLCLACCFSMVVVFNLIALGLIKADPAARSFSATAANLLDTSLMLIALRYFTDDPGLRKLLLTLSWGYLCFELALSFVTPSVKELLMISLGPGLFMIMILAGYFFLRHVRSSFNYSKDKGRAFMSGALTFAYACFSFLFVAGQIIKDNNHSDILKIYHLAHAISSITMCIGLIIILRENRKKPVESRIYKREDPHTLRYL